MGKSGLPEDLPIQKGGNGSLSPRDKYTKIPHHLAPSASPGEPTKHRNAREGHVLDPRNGDILPLGGPFGDLSALDVRASRFLHYHSRIKP